FGLEIDLRPVGALVLAATDVVDQMRLYRIAAARQPRHHRRDLQRRRRNLTLADRAGDRLAGIPLLAGLGFLPRGRRNRAAVLVGNIEFGLVAEAQSMGDVGDRVDAGAVADVVEINVAGLRDAFDEAQRAVAAVLVFVAIESVAAQRVGAAAGDVMV